MSTAFIGAQLVYISHNSLLNTVYIFDVRRDINDGSWSGSIYDDGVVIGYFSLTCFENSCVGEINIWTTDEEFVINPVKKNGQVRAAALMKVLYSHATICITLL